MFNESPDITVTPKEESLGIPQSTGEIRTTELKKEYIYREISSYSDEQIEDTESCYQYNGEDPEEGVILLQDDDPNNADFVLLGQYSRVQDKVDREKPVYIRESRISEERVREQIHGSLDSLFASIAEGESMRGVKDDFRRVTDIVDNLVHEYDDDFLKFFKIEKDRTTEDHSVNTMALALLFYNKNKDLIPELKEMGMKNFALCFLLHDIGKADPKLNGLFSDYERPFTDNDRKRMKQHPMQGVHMINKFQYSNDKILIDAVMKHHERLDGSGYPYGLKDDELGLVPRLIGIIDSFEAMLSKDRKYKTLQHEEVKPILIALLQDAQKGKYDKNILEMFIYSLKKD